MSSNDDYTEDEDIDEVPESTSGSDELWSPGDVDTDESLEKDPELKRVFMYSDASRILNDALVEVVSHCRPGSKILDICEVGDSIITKKAAAYKKKSVSKSKGIAFPTSVSVNNILCNFCPLATDETTLKEKDIVKIEMACHVAGYIAVSVYTHVVSGEPITGRLADTIGATKKAADIITKIAKPGIKTKDLTDIIQKVAAAFDCKSLEIFRCQQLKCYDGVQPIKSLSSGCDDDDDFVLEHGKAYSIDIAMATGDPKLEFLEKGHTTIYKRNLVERNAELKEDSLDPVLSEIREKFPSMPFPSRALENGSPENLLECVNHEALVPYPIVQHSPGQFVARLKFTLLVKKRGTHALTSSPKQEVRPMSSSGDNSDLMKLMATERVKGKGKESTSQMLSYCGRLPVGVESSGVKPTIFDVSWNRKLSSKFWGQAGDAIACTGTFGTCIFVRSPSLRGMNLQGNIDDGWTKEEMIMNTRGKFCRWSYSGVFLAVGFVRESDQLGEICVLERKESKHGSGFIIKYVYLATDDGYVGMNSLSWSHNDGYILVASNDTRHVMVIKKGMNMFKHIEAVRFANRKDPRENLVAAFHPSHDCFVAASSNGVLRYYYKRDKQSLRNTKYEWNDCNRPWSDDCGITDLSFDALGERLICARTDLSIKIWNFSDEQNKFSPSELCVVPEAGLYNLSVKSIKNKTGVVDLFAVGDGRQTISIHETDGCKLCDNKHSIDSNAHFPNANAIDWHPKEGSILASGGYDGFVLFWTCHSDNKISACFTPKQRNRYLEDLHYSHQPLPRGTARTTLEEYDMVCASFRNNMKKLMEENENQERQMDQVVTLTSTGLHRLDQGEVLSPTEVREYLHRILCLCSKKVVDA